MGLVIRVPAAIECRLNEEADRQGRTPEEVALALLQAALDGYSAEWTDEDMADATLHALRYADSQFGEQPRALCVHERT